MGYKMLKSLGSEPKNYPRSSKNWSVLWKNVGHVGHQIFFQCEIWCDNVAKFVTLSVIDDLRIISVINRVASKNNLTTKPVWYVLCLFVLLILQTLKMAFKNIINLSVAPIGRRIRDVWNMQSGQVQKWLREIGFWDIFFVNLFRFLQDIGPNVSSKKMKTGCMVFTSQWL